jgi:hypothetical protein
MSADAEFTEPVRLDVVAALVETDAATALPGQATCDERRLAEALHGEPEGTPGPEAPALSELLRLAEGASTADTLVVGLEQAFLIPDDSWPSPARERRTDAFADVYRRLAMPGLSGESGARAQAILNQLTRA